MSAAVSSLVPRSVLELAPGLYYDVPDAVYHRRELGIVSNTALKEFSRAPLAYRAWLAGQDEETPALRFGKLLHTAVFEPERFAREFAIAPEFGPCNHKGPKDARERWRKEQLDRGVGEDGWVSADEGARIKGMVRTLYAHPKISRMLGDGASEVTIRWNDPSTGLPCKARIDYLAELLSLVLDLKSTLDATQESFTRDMGNHGYHRQEAHYRAGLAALGCPVSDFVFGGIEKAPPYLIGLYQHDAAAVEAAARKNAEDMARFADCLARDHWPGLPEQVVTVSLKPWVLG